MSNSNRGDSSRTNSQPPKSGLLYQLARARRRLAKATRRWRAIPQAKEPPDWRSILTKGEKRDCPAPVFRKLSAEFREAGDLAAAEKICTSGVEIYPDCPALAVEHANIAMALDDPGLKLARWQRVIEIQGDESPAKAFKNLADCYQAQGDYQLAEAVVRRGMALFPHDFNLEERLARISLAAGFSARAIQHWSDLIEHHPQSNHAWVYLRISDALCKEGLLDRAAGVLAQQLAAHPGDGMLEQAASKLAAVRAQPLPGAVMPIAPKGPTGFTDHLFTDGLEPFGRGKCAFPFRLDPRTEHLPAMLDFADCVSSLREPGQAAGVDVFVTWGAGENFPHDLARNLAKAGGKPNLCIDFGFITSRGHIDIDSPRPSFIICPDVIYFDSTQPSPLESKLNSSDHRLTAGQSARAKKCAATIVRHRITRHTYATQTDLRPRFPSNGRKRVLLVDQQFGDHSVDKGLGGELSFQRMLDVALAMPDHEILVPLYPATRSDRRESYLGPMLPDPLPPNFTILEFEVNPYCLFEVVDLVFVVTSHFGFEALMAGKEVHCFASPFYAGWGLTNDLSVVPRRKRRRELEEIFHLFYIEHSRYHVPDRGAAELEDLVDYLIESGDASHRSEEKPRQAGVARTPAAITAKPRGETLNIVIIPIGGRLSAAGRYTQNLAWSLCQLGCRVLVLTADKKPSMEAGVQWLPRTFEGMRLAPSVREAIVNFAPDIIYENGVRSNPQRAALEAMILTNARLALQSEDDDVQVYETHHGKAAADAMTLIDKPLLTRDDISRFLQHNNWRLSLNVLFNPDYDRWVEPITRALCYRLASLHTVVWHPFAERLERDYGVSSFVVPPVASAADFERLLPTVQERESILRQYGIDPGHVVFFIGGALYAFSSEYAYFLDALNRTAAKSRRPMALVIASGRSWLPIARMARERLRPEIAFADIGLAGDEVYMEMLKACDVVCSPGLPDTFNRFRLPSRLVKAMAMGKPVLTCRCGFGESLENGVNAFLTEGEDPADWAETIALCLDDAQRAAVGNQGRIFAREHFDSDRVAAALKEKFEEMLADPSNPLADGILHGEADPEADGIAKARARAGIKLRAHQHSTMQDAIHLLATRCNHLHTVVHIGAGRCAEFDDYCRLGAERIVLIEARPDQAARLRELDNFNGRIIVKQAVVAGTRGSHPAYLLKNTRTDARDAEEFGLLRPSRLLDWMPCIQVAGEENVTTCTIADVCADLTFENPDNMLVLELQGLEAQALEVVPKDLLQNFQWIAMRLSEEPLYENGATREAVEAILIDACFERVPAPQNFSELKIPELFRLKTGNG